MQRLDYILASRPVVPLPVVAADVKADICVQHAWIPREFLGLSDHKAVAIDLNDVADYCNPRLARPVGDNEFGQDSGWGNMTAQLLNQSLDNPGSMQWFRVDENGTYAIGLDATDSNVLQDLRFEVYSADNLSIPLGGDQKKEKVTIKACFTTDGPCKDMVAQKYVLPKTPFDVRVFSTNRDWSGSYKMVFYRFRCDSQQEACDLLPNQPQNFDFPNAKALNPKDVAWFRIEINHQADSVNRKPSGSPPIRVSG